MTTIAPDVSVIITNYNHGQYLRQRIDSVLRQDFKNFEVIILDDGSKDNSEEIISSFRHDPRIVHIELNKVNSNNAFSQWAKGFQQSRGKYIWIAEGDDFCEPSFLTVLVTPMLENQSLTLSFCQTLYVTPDGAILGRSFAENLQEIIPGKQFVAEKMLGLNGVPNVSLAVFKKSAIPVNFEEVAHMRYCRDWHFWIQIALKGDVNISGRYLSYFRRHGQNISSSSEINGLFFLEGNSFFQDTVNRSGATDIQIAGAIQLKVNRYFEYSGQMPTSVRKKVLESLLKLDVTATKYYRYKVRRNLAGSLAHKITRLLK